MKVHELIEELKKLGIESQDLPVYRTDADGLDWQADYVVISSAIEDASLPKRVAIG